MMTQDLARLIARMDDVRVIENAQMSERTSFRAGGFADLLAFPRTSEALARLLRVLDDAGVSRFIMGKGTNLLVTDEGYRGAIVALGDELSDICVNGREITALAGASLKAVVQKGLEAGLTGAEALSGIPGSAGGAAAMNAGAYGSETAEFLIRADVLDQSLKPATLSNGELDFGYRQSAVSKNGLTVVRAVFRLTPGDVSSARERIHGFDRKRREKQPLSFPSAGSAFKRPAGHYAGELIERSGMKGAAVGGARVSEKHAGFIINAHNSSASDIIELIRLVQKRVFETCGVKLLPEVKIIGEGPKPIAWEDE